MLHKAIAAVEDENDKLEGVLKNNIDFNVPRPCSEGGFRIAGQVVSCPSRKCRQLPVIRCMISRTLFSGRTTSNGKQNSVLK